MNGRQWVVFFAALAIPMVIWFTVGSGRMSRGSAPSTAGALQAAGVHKCVGAGGTNYIDGPCPVGSHEVAANGGTMTVTSFPKAVQAPSMLASGPLVRPMDPEERDRLRDKAIDAAANRR